MSNYYNKKLVIKCVFNDRALIDDHKAKDLADAIETVETILAGEACVCVMETYVEDNNQE